MKIAKHTKQLSGLIIDDDTTWATPLKIALESQLGCQAKVCIQGDTGLMAIMSRKPSFIILDWNMPGVLNGPAVLSIIRQKPSMDNVPILLATSRDKYEDIKGMIELGADDYICKPTSLRKVVAIIASLLDRRQTETKAHKAARTYARSLVCENGIA